MKSNFNFIAPFYDQLAYLIYGDNLLEAKKAFFPLIPPDANVLLMGAGTGNILNDLFEKNPTVQIDFVEPSRAMIRIAQKRLLEKFQRQVNFICGDHHAIPAGKRYHVVTSFFVLDCFKQGEALEFGKAITSGLEQNGLWLFADFFYTKNKLQRGLIWFMYRFFRVTANISADKLPDYNALMERLNFKVTGEKILLKGLIRSQILGRET